MNNTPRQSRVYRRNASLVQYLIINYVIHHIYSLKNKKQMVISFDAEKSFDKIQHPFVIICGKFVIIVIIIKTLSKLK